MASTPRSKRKRTSTTKPEGAPLVGFGLGANLGDARLTLGRALAALRRELGELAVSPLYRTQPLSPIAQPDFLNAVALARSHRAPEALLALALEIERQLGRRRSASAPPGGPREIDLDLLFAGDQQLTAPDLVLPHPRLRLRRFVLAPLHDLAPDLGLPPDGASVSTLLAALPASPTVECLTDLDWSSL